MPAGLSSARLAIAATVSPALGVDQRHWRLVRGGPNKAGQGYAAVSLPLNEALAFRYAQPGSMLHDSACSPLSHFARSIAPPIR